MTDFIEWIPKHHGHKPLYWTPDMLTGLDGKNYVRQPNWSWIAGSTYYVPYEAVYGMSRDVDELLTDGAGPVEDGVEAVDPLAAALAECEGVSKPGPGYNHDAKVLREALAKRGLKIVETGQ